LEFARSAKPGASFLSKVRFTDFTPRANAALQWRLPRRATNAALRAYLKIRHEMEVEGLENLSSGGPFVFTPNHSSHMDLISLAGSIPSSMVHQVFAVAAKDYFFNRTWKALGARTFVNAIPFDRKGRVQESMARCREALAEGGSLVIFPEGTRSPKGNLLDFKPGVGQLLAGSPNVRAVPVFIDGAYRIMPKGSRRPGAGQLRIRYGKPISFVDTPATPEGLRQIAERLHAEVKALSQQ
jgi:long-chain acyl-CoA synthetase